MIVTGGKLFLPPFSVGVTVAVLLLDGLLCRELVAVLLSNVLLVAYP